MTYQHEPDPMAKLMIAASGLLAIVFTFFLFPLVFNNTLDWINAYSEAQYGFSGGLISFVWGVIVLALVFSASAIGVFSAIWLVRSKLGGW